MSAKTSLGRSSRPKMGERMESPSLQLCSKLSERPDMTAGLNALKRVMSYTIEEPLLSLPCNLVCSLSHPEGK